VAHGRASIALTDAEVDALLRAGRTLVLVTNGPDGIPDPVPMWYLVDDDGVVWMRTYAKSQKVVSLERDPRFAALVEDGERYTELRGVQLSGTVELVDDDGVVWMRTYAKSQKVVSLERDPRFAALVEDGERYTELRGVQLSGTVELVDDVERICEVFAGLMVKYEGLEPEHVESVKAAYRDRAPKQRALRLHVSRTVSWDHAKQAGT
jgi:general stress protein 26